ncbi:serine hydrolase domain-containing protein [Terriglobus tenax]|uniref:serine hydrolase domain-containing protein n=1 Tax=Terriglobus tenax TaxID=1111115 RepID=UPI0021E0B9C3|nr:serine hydrolase domain-containing protein [Terriglobus tenax]
MPLTRRRFLANSSLALLTSVLKAEPTSSFAETVQRYVDAQHFSGVILLGRKQHIAEQYALGDARTEPKIPVTVDTIFEGGSISKWIASIVVLKQVDAARLSLDVPISTYLPAFRKDNGEKLTLAHLMSHQSGVPNQVIPAFRADRTLQADPDEAVARWASGDLQFEPGSQWDYSHSNWLLVRAALEHATGKTYEELAGETLWKPLRLKHSGIFHGASMDVPGMAESRKADGTADPSTMPSFMAMAGGFYTNAPEMLRILDAVDSGKILSHTSTERLFTIRMPQQHYALGGRVRMRTLAEKERAVLWEDGSNRSFRMLAVRVRGTGESVIVMNHRGTDQPAMGDFADAGLQWLS